MLVSAFIIHWKHVGTFSCYPCSHGYGLLKGTGGDSWYIQNRDTTNMINIDVKSYQNLL